MRVDLFRCRVQIQEVELRLIGQTEDWNKLPRRQGLEHNAVALARKVVEVIEANPDVELAAVYGSGDPAIEKITKVAQKVYGAEAIELSERAKKNLARFTRWGFGELPICIAKTQYSLSDDPKRLGAPPGWTLRVTDITLSAGAGFLVVISGTMMLMPGLPKVSHALGIDGDEHGDITGMS